MLGPHTPAGRLSCLPSLCRARVTDSPGSRMAAICCCRAAVCGLDISGASSAAAIRRCRSRICCLTFSLTTAAACTCRSEVCKLQAMSVAISMLCTLWGNGGKRPVFLALHRVMKYTTRPHAGMCLEATAWTMRNTYRQIANTCRMQYGCV